MIIASQADRAIIIQHIIRSHREINWLGGVPEDQNSWSVFQAEHEMVAIFEEREHPWNRFAFFFEPGPVTPHICQAFRYKGGGEFGTARVTKIDPTVGLHEVPVIGETSFEVKPLWVFVFECLRRYEGEILKGDYTKPPVGDHHFTWGRINTPEHRYSDGGLEVRLHDVSTDQNIQNHLRAYWLRVADGQHQLEVKLHSGWGPRCEIELHVIEPIRSAALYRAA